MDAKKIIIENKNNKLQCHAFVEIGPEPGAITDSAFEKLYCTSCNGEDIFFKLADYLRLRFIDIGSAFTIPAEGMESMEWRAKYRAEHPEVTNDTKLAVYFFKRTN